MNTFLTTFNDILTVCNDFLYSKFLIIVLIGAGIYFTVRSKFVQIRLLPEACRVVTEKSHTEGGMSSFQALMIATASRVGTGNIAGIATAIVAGGPGALFWMWIMCIIGGASAFVESTLAQVYKEKDGSIFKGGPAYYIQKALGQRWLGIVFAILLILTFAFGFNGLQAFNISSAFEYYVANFSESYVPMIIGLILAIASALLFFRRISQYQRCIFCSCPCNGHNIYIIISIVIFIVNIKVLPSAMSTVFEEAFDFESIFGGFAGSCMVMGNKERPVFQ